MRRAERPAGEVVAALRAVGQLQPLAEGGEGDGVLAHHVAAPDRVNADLHPRALAREPVATVDAALRQIAAEGLGHDLRHPRRRAAGRVLLEAVMHLGDLHVVLLAEEARHVGEHPEHHVDPHAHVGREEDGNLLGEALDLRALGGREAGRPDHGPRPLARGHAEVPEARVGSGELDEHAVTPEGPLGIGADGNPELAESRHLTRVLEEGRVAGRL